MWCQPLRGREEGIPGARRGQMAIEQDLLGRRKPLTPPRSVHSVLRPVRVGPVPPRTGWFWRGCGNAPGSGEKGHPLFPKQTKREARRSHAGERTIRQLHLSRKKGAAPWLGAVRSTFSPRRERQKSRFSGLFRTFSPRCEFIDNLNSQDHAL